MAVNLPRVTQKIFAGDSNSEQVSVFGTMQNVGTGGQPTYSKDAAQIQSSNFAQGWDSAVLADSAPFMEDMNAVQYVLSSQIAYLLQHGMPEYDPNTTYFADNCYCQYNGKWYKSLTDNNIGNQPDTSTANWEEFSLGGSGTGGMPLGMIYPLPSTSSYIPDNSHPCNGAEYSGADGEMFAQFYNDYLTGGKLQTCTYTEQAQQIAQQGFCAQFAIDTDNQTFKMPVIPDGLFLDLASTVPVIGDGKALGLTNGTTSAGMVNFASDEAFLTSGTSVLGAPVGTNSAGFVLRPTNLATGVVQDPTLSGLIAQTSDLAKKANFKWFVVVSTESIPENAIDWNAYFEPLAGKANADLTNVASNIDFVVERYTNGASWYEVYKSGWIRQGGSTGLISTGNRYDAYTITFLKPFRDSNYTFTNCPNKYNTQNGLGSAYPPFIYRKTNTQTVIGQWAWTDGCDWVACGYGA